MAYFAPQILNKGFMKTILFALLLSTVAFGFGSTQGELDELKTKNKWTFEVKERALPYATGLVKEEKKFEVGRKEPRFLQAVGEILGKFFMSDKWKLAPIMDQKSCGSCVIYSVVANFMDSLSIRGIVAPMLSTGQLMNCGKGYQCNGYWFDGAAADLVTLGGLVSDAAYPYVPQTGACKQVSATKYGQIQGYKLTDNSHKTIMQALLAGYPISTTVGADNIFMNYNGGIYNACTNQATNHETVIEGFDCEDQVDAKGNCILDATGRVAAGKGYWLMRNSWGTGWGDKGWMKIKMSKAGNNKSLCNNLTEEVGYLETGIPVPDPKPAGKDFAIETEVASVKGTVAVKYVQFYDNIVKVITEFLNAFKE